MGNTIWFLKSSFFALWVVLSYDLVPRSKKPRVFATLRNNLFKLNNLNVNLLFINRNIYYDLVRVSWIPFAATIFTLSLPKPPVRRTSTHQRTNILAWRISFAAGWMSESLLNRSPAASTVQTDGPVGSHPCSGRRLTANNWDVSARPDRGWTVYRSHQIEETLLNPKNVKLPLCCMQHHGG